MSQRVNTTLEGPLSEAEELAPAVGLQGQDPSTREHHHHPRLRGGGDEDAEEGDHEPLFAVPANRNILASRP